MGQLFNQYTQTWPFVQNRSSRIKDTWFIDGLLLHPDDRNRMIKTTQRPSGDTPRLLFPGKDVVLCDTALSLNHVSVSSSSFRNKHHQDEYGLRPRHAANTLAVIVCSDTGFQMEKPLAQFNKTYFGANNLHFRYGWPFAFPWALHISLP